MLSIKCVQSCQNATSMIARNHMYPSLLYFTVIVSSDDVQISSNLDSLLTKTRSMWYACPGIKTSSSFDLLSLYFVTFAFSQNGHLKNDVLVESPGIPLLHFFVSFIVCWEEYPILWCHSLRSFIFCESGGSLSVVISSGGASLSKSAFVISGDGSVVSLSNGNKAVVDHLIDNLWIKRSPQVYLLLTQFEPIFLSLECLICC